MPTVGNAKEEKTEVVEVGGKRGVVFPGEYYRLISQG
jgi:hypothetical protein